MSFLDKIRPEVDARVEAEARRLAVEAALPEEERCYRAADGEEVEVVAVADMLGVDPVDRLAVGTVVVYRHSGVRRGHAALVAEWQARGFAPITRREFAAGDRSWSHRGAGWALVLIGKGSKVREARDSREVAVVRVREAHRKNDGPLEVTFWRGKGRLTREALDGQVHEFRDDARRAKQSFCASSGIKLAGWQDHHEYDGEYP